MFATPSSNVTMLLIEATKNVATIHFLKKNKKT